MSEHRDALSEILVICNGTSSYKRRIQNIHEVAMRALGMTHSQRTERHNAIFQRVGDQSGFEAFTAREVKRQQIAGKFCPYVAKAPKEATQ